MTHPELQLPAGATVAWSLDEVPRAPSVVTIGNFDGVHRGHRVLLDRTTSIAREGGIRSAAVTFDPHPAAVLRPGSQPPSLQTVEQRVVALAEVGLDLVLVLPFTRDLAALSPAEFVQRVLVDRLRADRVVVGSNFRFGHRAAGDVTTLREEGRRHGFGTETVEILELDGAPIASTQLRERVAAGEMSWVTRALGRPYSVVGEVVRGEGRGRTIGVPTANVAVPAGILLPSDGVYAGHVATSGGSSPAVTNIGTRPTFRGVGRTVEAHLLDGERDLYGARVEVSFEHRLRGEQRFEGPDELVAQIHRDIDAARRALGRGDGS